MQDSLELKGSVQDAGSSQIETMAIPPLRFKFRVVDEATSPFESPKCWARPCRQPQKARISR